MKLSACWTNWPLLLLHLLSIKSLRRAKRLHILASWNRESKGVQSDQVELSD